MRLCVALANSLAVACCSLRLLGLKNKKRKRLFYITHIHTYALRHHNYYMMMATTTTRLSTLRSRLEEKRQQIAACPRGKRGRVLFQTMRWLFYHAIPKNSSIYDAMVGDAAKRGFGLLGALRRTLLARKRAKAAGVELQLAL